MMLCTVRRRARGHWWTTPSMVSHSNNHLPLIPILPILLLSHPNPSSRSRSNIRRTQQLVVRMVTVRRRGRHRPVRRHRYRSNRRDQRRQRRQRGHCRHRHNLRRVAGDQLHRQVRPLATRLHRRHRNDRHPPPRTCTWTPKNHSYSSGSGGSRNLG